MPKKAFVVYPRNKSLSKEGIVIGGKRKRFNGGSFINVDENAAKEISDTYGKHNVHVVEDQQLARAVNAEKWEVTEKNEVKTLHNYTFGPTKAYSNAWEEFEKRRKDKQKRGKRRKGAEVDSGDSGNKHSTKHTD